MKNHNRNLFIGLALFALGTVSLLDNLGFIYFDGELIVGALFLASSALLFERFRQQERMRYLIFAAGLAYVGLAVLMQTIRGLDDNWSGILLFLMTSAVSGFAYFRNPQKWKFALVSGLSITLALLVFLEMFWWLSDEFMGSFFFLGLGLTFGFLYFIRNNENNLSWAKIPALSLLSLAVLLFLTNLNYAVSRFALPILLIATGAGLVVWGAKKTERQQFKQI